MHVLAVIIVSISYESEIDSSCQYFHFGLNWKLSKGHWNMIKIEEFMKDPVANYCDSLQSCVCILAGLLYYFSS